MIKKMCFSCKGLRRCEAYEQNSEASIWRRFVYSRLCRVVFVLCCVCVRLCAFLCVPRSLSLSLCVCLPWDKYRFAAYRARLPMCVSVWFVSFFLSLGLLPADCCCCCCCLASALLVWCFAFCVLFLIRCVCVCSLLLCSQLRCVSLALAIMLNNCYYLPCIVNRSWLVPKFRCYEYMCALARGCSALLLLLIRIKHCFFSYFFSISFVLCFSYFSIQLLSSMDFHLGSLSIYMNTIRISIHSKWLLCVFRSEHVNVLAQFRFDLPYHFL